MKNKAWMHSNPLICHCLQLHVFFSKFTGYLHSLFSLSTAVTSASKGLRLTDVIFRHLVFAFNFFIQNGIIFWPTNFSAEILWRNSNFAIIIVLILSNKSTK